MRRFKQNILPFIIIGVIVGVISGGLWSCVYQGYRQQARQETAALLGAAASASLAEMGEPDATSTGADSPNDALAAEARVTQALVQNLRSPSSEQVALGEKLLHQSGYLADELAAPSGQKLLAATASIIILSVCITLLLAVGYVCWRDARRRQQIQHLTRYVQDLSQRIYDLKLVENSEDELSLLSNELYKITVALREAAESNRQTRQQLETALADISHQLRTPLTSLQLTLDNLVEDPKMPAGLRQEFLRSAARQTEAMSGLVTTLLHLAKFDNGSIKLQARKVKIGKVLSAVIDNLNILAELQNVNLELSGDLDATISLDARWQTEALTNIVKNCIEHSPAGSKVELRAVAGPLFVRVIITDQGEGITPHDLAHIFERFYRAENSQPTSVGIGLAFAKAIIEANHGQISARSTEGEGTTFTITYFR